MSKVDVSVVMINYNSSDYTIACLERLWDQPTDLIIEYILVDNASEESYYQQINNWVTSKPVAFIPSDLNLGFAGGNMLGARQAKGRYLIFLNNDVTVDIKTFEYLIYFMENTPNAGVCGPKVYDEDGKELRGLDHFPCIAKDIFGRNVMEFLWPNKYPKRFAHYDSPVLVNAIQGSLMCFRGDAFWKIDGMDTKLFLYFEEIDICFRLKMAGYHTYFIPEVSYIHYEGKSTSERFLTKQELQISYYYILKKHFGSITYWVILLSNIVANAIKGCFKPSKFKMLKLLLKRCPQSKSLRHLQVKVQNR